MSFEEKMLSKLTECMDKFGRAADLARASGISNANISRWFRGLQSPKLSDLGALCDTLHIDIVAPDDPKTFYEYAYIPKVEAKAGAGASLETSDEVEGLYAFRQDFLCRMGISKNSVMMDVVGDSMEPLIQGGDTVLIDQNDKTIREEGKIFVVTLGDELRIKRIFKGLDGLILRSENKIYPDITVSGQDLDRLIIHGRVRWFGRSI